MTDSDAKSPPEAVVAHSNTSGDDLAAFSSSALSGVLGLLAHDLRNPLAALSSNVGFLGMMSEELSEDTREAVADLQLSIEALGRIIDSLELVCNDLAGVAMPKPLRIRVGDVLRAVLPPLDRAAKSHGVTLEVQADPYLDDFVVVSEVMFSRALAALLQNAITAAPGKSTVRLQLLREEHSVVFRVDDDGAALSPELAERALSAPGQLEVKSARGGRYSRGLGLYAVARSAELSCARLRVGERDQGSRMELWVPASS